MDRTSTSRASVTSRRIHIAPIWCALLLLAACGGDGPAPTTPAPSPAPPPAPPPPAPPPGDDHGDTEATATAVSIPSTTNGEIDEPIDLTDESGDLDLFRFQLNSSGMWLTVHTSGSTDTIGALAGPNDLEAADDDSGEGENFRIVVGDAPAGTYYIGVAGWAAGRYALHVTASRTPPADDHGNSQSSATAVRVPSTTSGDLEHLSDADHFRFRLDSPVARLLVYTTGSADTAGVLSGPNGLRLEDDDSGEFLNFRFAVRDAPAGTYYVAVEPAQFDSSSPLGEYALHVEEAPADDHGDTEASATPVDVPSTTDGELEFSDDVDYFRFRLNSSGGRLVIHTTGSADPAATLFGPNGLRLEDDDSGDLLNFRIAVSDAAAGVYYVAVRPAFGGFFLGEYSLHVAHTPPATPGAWRAAGTGERLLDLPTRIEFIRITGEYDGNSENFVVWCGSDRDDDAGGLLVNELMGTFWEQTRFSGTFPARRDYNRAGDPCRQLEVKHSEGVRWTMAEVPSPAGALTPSAGTGSESGDRQAAEAARIRSRLAVPRR